MARRTPASSSEDPPAAGPSGGRESLPDITQPEADTPGTRSRLTARLNRPGVFGGGVRATATGAGRSRERACKRPDWAEAQHRGIFCVSCLNGSQMLRGRSWVRSRGSAEPAGMRSSTRHGGVPPTSVARVPHGTSPFPVTRVSRSRSAEAMSGARRSPSAARRASYPGPPGCGLRMCSQTMLVPRSATSDRCVRFMSARGTARRRRPRTDHPLLSQHRHRGRRPD
jgi:hypothetical protein